MVIVSIANKGEANVAALVFHLQPVPELLDIVLHSLNPPTHRTSAIHHEAKVHLPPQREVQQLPQRKRVDFTAQYLLSCEHDVINKW